MSKLLPAIPIAACLAAGACDGQVDADHRGTVLAQLSGTIRSSRTLPVGDAEVLALWVADAPVDRHALESVEVAATFPARFALSFYEPPVPDALSDFPGAQLGVALLSSTLVGTDFSTEELASSGLLGMDTEHLLVYAPIDIPEGSFASYLLHSTPRAGYHLYGVHRLTAQELEMREACLQALREAHEGEEPSFQEVYTQCGGQTFDDFVPLPDDLAAPIEIELVDDPRTIMPPNWG